MLFYVSNKNYFIEHVSVFIFAAPPHDCSTLLSRKNLTFIDEESGKYFYADEPNGIKKGVVAYDYTSLFPTLTSDVRFMNYHLTWLPQWLLPVVIAKKCGYHR